MLHNLRLSLVEGPFAYIDIVCAIHIGNACNLQNNIYINIIYITIYTKYIYVLRDSDVRR